MRELFLGAALTFIALFGGLTVYVIVRNGVSVANVLALLIVAMIALGVYGAIRNPPPPGE